MEMYDQLPIHVSVAQPIASLHCANKPVIKSQVWKARSIDHVSRHERGHRKRDQSSMYALTLKQVSCQSSSFDHTNECFESQSVVQRCKWTI